MTPEDLAKTGSEGAHQTALFAWAALAKKQYPELAFLYHVPNGDSRAGDLIGPDGQPVINKKTGKRMKDVRSAMITGGRLKAQGVKAGVPDVGLDVARQGKHGLRIEMKKPGLQKTKNGGCSDEQVAWLDHLSKQGYAVFVAYSWTDAKNILIWYLT